MKNLSRWASRHVRVAIPLIVFCETANAVNGLLLGTNLLADWPVGLLAGMITLLLAGVVFIQTGPGSIADMPYWTGRRWLFGAFVGNFFLFLLLGGLWAGPGQSTPGSWPVWGSHQIHCRFDTLAPTNARPLAANEAYYAERPTDKPGRQVGTRIAFVLVFFASIFLCGFSMVLACQLACAGNGALAFVVFLVGVLIPVPGFMFLSRAFEKVIKPWRQMNRLERQRVNRRAGALALGVIVILYLVAQLSNP